MAFRSSLSATKGLYCQFFVHSLCSQNYPIHEPPPLLSLPHHHSTQFCPNPPYRHTPKPHPIPPPTLPNPTQPCPPKHSTPPSPTPSNKSPPPPASSTSNSAKSPHPANQKTDLPHQTNAKRWQTKGLVDSAMRDSVWGDIGWG